MDDGRVLPARHRLTYDDVFRMSEAGFFGEGVRVELIDGDLIDMAPIGQSHEGSVNGLNESLVITCVGRALVSCQNSLRLDQWNAPQPDFAVYRYRADRYATGERAGPADVLLLVEVADSSLGYDRTVKLPMYARAGIPEVWIVDLKHRTLECHRVPDEGRYAQVTTHVAGERLALAAAPEIVVPLNLMFG